MPFLLCLGKHFNPVGSGLFQDDSVPFHRAWELRRATCNTALTNTIIKPSMERKSFERKRSLFPEQVHGSVRKNIEAVLVAHATQTLTKELHYIFSFQLFPDCVLCVMRCMRLVMFMSMWDLLETWVWVLYVRYGEHKIHGSLCILGSSWEGFNIPFFN